MFKKRTDGGFDLDELIGTSVMAIRLVGLVELFMGEDQQFKLQIERDFLVRGPSNPDGARVEFRPYDNNWFPTGMNELASLYGAVIFAGDASPDATLCIAFSNGKSLVVQPDPLYEGWSLWHPQGVLGQTAGVGFA